MDRCNLISHTFLNPVDFYFRVGQWHQSGSGAMNVKLTQESQDYIHKPTREMHERKILEITESGYT